MFEFSEESAVPAYMRVGRVQKSNVGILDQSKSPVCVVGLSGNKT